MLQLLLMAFIAISVVYCQKNCPIYSEFKNDASLIKVKICFSKFPVRIIAKQFFCLYQELSGGPFYKIFTTGASIADCQLQIFTIAPNNNIVSGYLQSSDYCLHLTNCDSSNPAYYQCDLIPLTSGHPTLPSTQRNRVKLVAKIGTGDKLCLIYSYCRATEDGVYLLCRKPPKFVDTLLSDVLQLLRRLIGLLTPLPDLRRINQAKCIFSKKCSPPS